MTDLTPLFNEALKAHNAPPARKTAPSLQHLDEFLKEAYIINSRISELNDYLKGIRQSYLSTAPPPRRHIRDSSKSRDQFQHLSDQDRDKIDADAKQLLRVLNSSIRGLADAEQLRQNTETTLIRKKYGSRLGGLGNWAAGGLGHHKSVDQEQAEAAANAVSTHRENVLWYLRQKLSQCGQLQASMMETRITREMEKNKSVLSRARGRMGADPAPGEPDLPKFEYKPHEKQSQEERGRGHVEDELTPQQLQMFEEQNQDMLRHYEETLNQVKTAEKSLVEISELQTQLVNNLATQSAHIDQLVADSYLTTENVGGGNKELKRASERKSTAKYVFYASCGVSIFLIVYDLII